MSHDQETPEKPPQFDFSAYPPDTFFHERRDRPDRRAPAPAPATANRRRKERRRKVDPTTFEKQYKADEIEFMNAIQAFKTRSGKGFPSYSEVLAVARSLGYRQEPEDDPSESDVDSGELVPSSC